MLTKIKVFEVYLEFYIPVDHNNAKCILPKQNKVSLEQGNHNLIFISESTKAVNFFLALTI